MSAPNASPDDLAAELAGLVRSGATSKALAECPAILSLEIVVARSPSPSTEDRAAAAHALLQQIVTAVDGSSGGNAAILLALAPGTRGSQPKRRRKLLADDLGVDVDHVRRYHEERLLTTVADELYGLDSAHRLRQRHRLAPEREPHESALRIDWLAQHRTYRRIWGPVTALRDDLYVLLRFLREDAEWADLADRTMNLSWRYAQLGRELQRFDREQGGLWLLATIDEEVAAADAMRRIGFHLPLGEADASWLRLELAQTPGEELDPFIDRLLIDEERPRELMDAWLQWARTCPCDLAAPDANSCEVHLWMNACDQFIRLIDADWYRIADHYRATDTGFQGIDVSELWDAGPGASPKIE